MEAGDGQGHIASMAPNVQGTRSVPRFWQEVFRRAEKGLATFGSR